MKNYLSLLLVFLLVPSFALAQGGTWTWMHDGSVPSYGIKGVPDPTNSPPDRYQPAYWTDKDGNFWLFGGVRNIMDLMNDLWKYDVASNTWIWMNGPDCLNAPDPAGVFGTQGVPSPLNYPPGRGYGANCWTDNNGDLWLYGGSGPGGLRDDLWRYHIATNEWTWIRGGPAWGNPPVFGSMGFPAAANTPGALEEVKSAWVDGANNLWMMGGSNNLASGAYATLWKYDMNLNMWTWIKGSNALNAGGSYGTYRVEDPGNAPKSRTSYTRWKDPQDNLYLFAGGNLSVNTGIEMYNDVWRYNIGAGNWTWISGSSSANDPGAYPPQQCTFYDNYFPHARVENQTAQVVNGCAKIYYTFGGFDLRNGTDYNDLWLFEADSFKWAWISGASAPNQPGVKGTLGVPSAANVPSSRGGVATWVDKDYNLWIYGGMSVSNPGYLGDMWRFTPDPSCIDIRKYVSSGLHLPDTLLCLGDSTDMYLPRPSVVSWIPAAGVTPNADTSMLIFSPPATTSYTVYMQSGNSCVASDTLHFTIRVLEVEEPVLDLRDTLLCTDDTAVLTASVANLNGNMQFRWEPQSKFLSDNRLQTVTLAGGESGKLSVTVTDAAGGCMQEASDSMIVSRAPIALVQVTPDQTIRYGDSIQLHAEGALFYTWLPAAYLNYPNIGSPMAWPAAPTVFTVYGLNNEGCRDTAYVRIGVDYAMHEQIPSAFSPNGDGRNDVFRILGLKHQRLLEFRVFNRWGQEVFSTTDPETGWDGRFRGVMQDPGVYHYLIRVAIPDGDARVYKGDVTLVR